MTGRARALLLVLAACAAACASGGDGGRDRSTAPSPSGSGPRDTGRNTASAPPAVTSTQEDAEGRHRILVGDAPARVRLARTQKEHMKGLSGVRSLEPDEGMLFVYPQESVRRFWMKDTLVPLDIAFLSGDLHVLSIATLPAPAPGTSDADMPRAASKRPVRYVLELPAGFFERHGLLEGARVTLPPDVLRPPDGVPRR